MTNFIDRVMSAHTIKAANIKATCSDLSNFSSVHSKKNVHKMSAKIPVEEIKFQVTLGSIAAKWWGSKEKRPILMLHGWLDNAGTINISHKLPAEFCKKFNTFF